MVLFQSMLFLETSYIWGLTVHFNLRAPYKSLTISITIHHARTFQVQWIAINLD